MMKSNFLNLPSSVAGDARRHVPFRSIINKHISILFVLSFVFSILFSYVHPVAALADPEPEYDPVYNTEIIRLTDYVDTELTPDQQDVFYIMFGAYLVAQGAMQDSLLDDPYTTQDGIIGWFKSCGIQIYNSAIVQNALMSPALLVSEGIQDLVDYAMGLAIKAGLVQSKVTWLDNVMSSDHYFLPFNQGLQIGINQVLAKNGGLFEWQVSHQDWNFPQFSWSITQDASQVQQDVYSSYVTNLTLPRIFLNAIGDNKYKNCLCEIPDNFSFYIVIDVDGRLAGAPVVRIYQTPNRIDYYDMVYYYNNDPRRLTNDMETVLNDYQFNLGDYSSYQAIANYYCSVISNYYYFYAYYAYPKFSFNYNEFCTGIYVLRNNELIELDNISDLDFVSTQLNYYLQVQNDYLLDLKGLIQDLIDVTVLKPVLYDNIYDPSGNQVTPVTNQVAVTVSLPDSGISIPNNLFSQLTKEGGYISYLWYMTKPLVQYTSDLVQTLVFPDDTGEGFDVTGPGAIVFGVISLGLIGGLVVKCLL